jgi:hypothetical protein
MPIDSIPYCRSQYYKPLVEVDEPAMVGVQATGIGPGGEIDFAGALEQVKGAATQLAHALQGMAAKPDDYEITFGIKLSASAGESWPKPGPRQTSR